jgi:hypothetical protein
LQRIEYYRAVSSTYHPRTYVYFGITDRGVVDFIHPLRLMSNMIKKNLRSNPELGKYNSKEYKRQKIMYLTVILTSAVVATTRLTNMSQRKIRKIRDSFNLNDYYGL